MSGCGKGWRSFLFGFLGVIVGALIAYHTLRRTPDALNWPVVSIARKVDPSVVIVLNKQRENRQLRTKGIGSGVILNRQGYIVTNYHVVASANELFVVLSSGKRYHAHVVGEDPASDLAVLKVKAGNLQPIAFSSSGTVEPGELVVAIGNALGLSHTVTTGVISAKDRVMYRDGWEYHLIQTDAAINPGNSGGALVNAQGQLIGINASKIAQTGVEGIGFAIPSNTVKAISTQLIKYGHVRRPWLGAALESAGSNSVGLLVVGVAPGSPAAKAGIRNGDFLVSINDVRVHQMQDIIPVIQKAGVGRIVQVGILRGNQPLTVSVKLGELPLTHARGVKRYP
ncbi:MAG: trypsin-like peptidase domain-containing protein [Firmicutes bacterium]|jgi:serine protease Do|nr:trypsin-like peptidase domain-containing protein [Bacillota bacterium]